MNCVEDYDWGENEEPKEKYEQVIKIMPQDKQKKKNSPKRIMFRVFAALYLSETGIDE